MSVNTELEPFAPTAEMQQPHHEQLVNIAEIDPREVEYIGSTMVERTVTIEAGGEQGANKLSLPENIGERIDRAKEASSFKGPEVEKAIEGYYKDHYAVGAAIEGAIDGTLEYMSPEDLEGSIENFTLRNVVSQLSAVASNETKGNTIIASLNILERVAFQEDALPAETVGGQERLYVQQLLGKIVEQAKQMDPTVLKSEQIITPDGRKGYEFTSLQPLSSDGLYFGILNPKGFEHKTVFEDRFMQSFDERVKWQSKAFWQDTRHSGQLLFHNTGNIDEITRNGHILRSRTRQRQLNGSFYSQTLTSNPGNGTDMHSNLPHFSELYDEFSYKRAYVNSKSEGQDNSATIALPLAEIVAVAPFARDAEYGVVDLREDKSAEKVIINDGLGDIGHGSYDGPGKSGLDRIFLADGKVENAQQAVDYDLDFGKNSVGTVILGMDEDNRGGSGQNFPGIRYVSARTEKTFNQESTEARTARVATLEQEIKSMQAESRSKPQYAGKIVVPLRRGVVEFTHEGKAGGRENNYQKYVRTAIY